MTLSRGRMSIFVLTAALVFAGAAHGAEDWSRTIAATVFGGRLYTIETSGTLYATDLGRGKYVAVGKPEFGKTKFMFAGPQNIYTIETDGSLYRIDPANGAWARIGESGAWRNTIAGTFSGGRLYTVEASGALYATSPVNGSWVQIGKADFGNTLRLYGDGDTLYSIEKDGSLYAINASTAAWRRIGDAGAWRGTTAGTVLGGRLYTVESSGVLYSTDLANGAWRKVGKADFGKTRYILGAGTSLYTLENSGLYRVDPVSGAWVTVG